jgi:hypothetical protein
VGGFGEAVDDRARPEEPDSGRGKTSAFGSRENAPQHSMQVGKDDLCQGSVWRNNGVIVASAFRCARRGRGGGGGAGKLGALR